jgi:predicted nucleic acid-binding protein
MAEMSRPREQFFDTTALVDIYRGRAESEPLFDAVVAARLKPYISVLTEAEIWRGVKLEEMELHEALLSRFVVIPLQSEMARLAGAWMQRYAASGLGWMDALIAATAKSAGLPLLTRDHRLAEVLAAELEFEIYG